jgi:hypothetical protein
VKIYGDQAYNGVFADEIRKSGIDFEKASKPESASGFDPSQKDGRTAGRLSKGHSVSDKYPFDVTTNKTC